jgi:hypothetical protein
MAWFLQIQVQVLSKPGVSRYKFDRSRETVTVQDFICGHWRSVAVQTVSEPEICHGAGFILGADARVRMQVLEGFVMGAGCRKNHDKQLTHIVRVMRSYFLKFVFISLS